MNAKCLLLVVATVSLALASVGCETVKPTRSGDPLLRITITASEEGETKTTLMGKDGNELRTFRVDSENPLKALRERFAGKQILGGGPMTIIVLRGSAHQVCGCVDGYCGCDPE
jgi:hypothetical protein